MGLVTAGISCNPKSPLSEATSFPITPLVGPEFVTGSTRMKSGTAQKMVLNMISTCLMIKLGHVKGNKMVDMQLSNNKLVDRGTIMVQNSLKIDYKTDLVVANILSSALIVLAPALAEYCNTNGKIALSGILQSQEKDLKKIYGQWFNFQPSNYKDGWVLISGMKR